MTTVLGSLSHELFIEQLLIVIISRHCCRCTKGCSQDVKSAATSQETEIMGANPTAHGPCMLCVQHQQQLVEDMPTHTLLDTRK